MQQSERRAQHDTPAELRRHLDDADPATLLLVLVQLTGEREWLARAAPFIQGPMSYQERMPQELRDAIRERLAQVLATSSAPRPQIDDDLMVEMMSVAAGTQVTDEYVPMMREDLLSDTLDSRRLPWRRSVEPGARAACDVLVIGAGMSGLAAAIQLQQAGIPYRVIEKNAEVGGTWYENRYPGCGVDTPNHFYSYAFEPNHEWSHFFAKRDELRAYFDRVADKFALRDRIAFDTEAEAAVWDEDQSRWHITARRGDGTREEWSARVIFSAVGILNRPKLPDVPGRDSFAGNAFHTAEWDQSFDWRGKRVAMIGTGASGHQVGPTIAPDVKRLMIFQRSPHWVVPNPNYHLGVSEGKKWALANIPHYLRWYRFQLFWGFADGLHAALKVDPEWPRPARSLNEMNERHRVFMEKHMRDVLKDRPDLLSKVIPDYPAYGKRILIDNHWFKMLTRDNVDLVTDDIAGIDPNGIRTADGRLWEADAIVYATGFKASRMLAPMTVTGRGGRDLHAWWGEDDARAYLGSTVPGFPNFFIFIGPNTGLAHGGNQIFMTECQLRYAMLLLREMIETGTTSFETREDVFETYNAEIDRLHAGMVWTHKGMTNWYRNKAGRVFAISPWRLVDYWKMTSKLDPADYVFA